MLKTHMDAIERLLVQQATIQNSTGHSLHKGTPREVFIREYLVTHLPANLAIGTGEIIDSDSKPGESRNQFDIVIYKNNYPKLDFGGGISGFLIESVIATIEVKSTLDEDGIIQTVDAAQKLKSLKPSISSSISSGYIPPKVLNYVVAYSGPAKMQTVNGWISNAHARSSAVIPDLPSEDNLRYAAPSYSLDGVFVLNKGFLYFDNVPMGFVSTEARKQNPSLKWVFADKPDGNLLLLFLFLQTATSNMQASWLNPIRYVSTFVIHGMQWA
jgi:hypothetical protein